MPQIGETLREARMRRRIDMAEVESATKIRAKYLRALESENKSQTISQPRVITANQRKATIIQGEERAYQSIGEGNVPQTEFKEAELSLEVTPQITPDNRIIMDLVIKNDSFREAAPGQAPLVFPVMSRGLKDPRALPPLLKRLERRPPWRDAFVAHAFARGEDPDDARRLFVALRSGPTPLRPPSRQCVCGLRLEALLVETSADGKATQLFARC